VGTLIDPDPPVAVAYGAIARNFGHDLALEEIDRRFRRAFQQQELLDRETLNNRTSEDRECERWRTIIAEVFEMPRNGERLFEALWDHFGEPAHWRVFADVASVWDELERRGLKLAIGSNFDRRLLPICQALAPLNRAVAVFASSQLGWRKPAPAFFEQVADRLEVAPGELVLVGDDPLNDSQAARAAGWRSVLLDRRGTADTATGSAIGRLDELIASDGRLVMG